MIYLIQMPFASTLYPPLGLPLVSAILKEAGLPVKNFFFNIELAKIMGFADYELFCSTRKFETFLLEWLFADAMWGCDSESTHDNPSERDLEAFALADVSDEISALLLKIKHTVVPQFIKDCVEKLNITEDVKVVGFSGLFQQLPSLLLGRIIKERYPHIKLVFGGSAFHGEVGAELFDKLEWIDAVSNSEADDVLVEAFSRLLSDKPIDDVQGFMHRHGGEIYRTAGTFVSRDALDSGIVPDFEEYFDAINGCDFGILKNELHRSYIPFESSRGCWWHEKSPCTFCGLNGVSSSYRVKTPENVIKNLKYYYDRYGARNFGATDNNLSLSYFKDFLPLLNETFPKKDISLFFCVKSNLGKEQLKQLSESGVTMVQPGIESLSDNILKLMNKGVSAIQNIYFLKCARRYGIFSCWYILMRMYGDCQADYDQMTSLIPYLTHFPPPGASRVFIHCHRYSTYYKESDQYFDEMKPAAYYSFLFPDFFDHNRLAYVFDVKWKNPSGENITFEALTKAIKRWQNMWYSLPETPALYIEEGGDDRGGKISLFDSRSGRAAKINLDLEESGVYKMLDDVIDRDTLLKETAAICSADKADEILDSFVRHGLAVRFGDKYLGLALTDGYKDFSLSMRRRLMNV